MMNKLMMVFGFLDRAEAPPPAKHDRAGCGGGGCGVFPFPSSVVFLLVYVFFQAYAYYGVSAILALFFSNYLGYADSSSVAFVHYFLSATFFFSIPGTIAHPHTHTYT